jgi:hypothetical protein
VEELKSRVRNRSEKNQAVRLVVVERGADLRDFETPGNEADGVHVIGQGRDESALSLAMRVIDRLASIERSESQLDRALLLVAPQVDGQSLAARELMARAMLTHASIAGAAELVLAVRADADPDVRHAVLNLVETLMGEHGAASMPIRIRFGGKADRAEPIINSVRPWGRTPRHLRAFSALRGGMTARGSGR